MRASAIRPAPAPITTDDDPRQRRKHIMAGAEVPPLPDKQRPLVNVLRDHALTTWGELRDVPVLDSAKAVEILAAAHQRILDSVRDDTGPYRKQIIELQRLVGQMAAMLTKIAKREATRGDPAGDIRVRCSVCGEPFSQHEINCKLAVLLREGKASGMSASLPP